MVDRATQPGLFQIRIPARAFLDMCMGESDVQTIQ